MHIIPLIVLCALLAISVFTDLTTNRIPNAITLPAIVFALTWQGLLAGWGGLIGAGAGFGIGVAAFLPMYLLGGMGAGDVKLMAASGSLLGPVGAVVAVGVTLIVGGFIGVLVLLKNRGLGEHFMLWMPPALHRFFNLRPSPPGDTSLKLRFPYATAIAFGAVVAALSANGVSSTPGLGN